MFFSSGDGGVALAVVRSAGGGDDCAGVVGREVPMASSPVGLADFAKVGELGRLGIVGANGVFGTAGTVFAEDMVGMGPKSERPVVSGQLSVIPTLSPKSGDKGGAPVLGGKATSGGTLRSRFSGRPYSASKFSYFSGWGWRLVVVVGAGVPGLGILEVVSGLAQRGEEEVRALEVDHVGGNGLDELRERGLHGVHVFQRRQV